MATPIQMPSLSPTMKEGKLTKWLKKVGDEVHSGDAIAEIETDKSNLELEAYDDGFLLLAGVKEGESAPVGATIGFIGEKGEKVEMPAGPQVAPAPQPVPEPTAAAPAPAPAPAPKPAAPAPAPAPSAPVAPRAEGRVRASPLAKKIAKERGLELRDVQGTGPLGRIIKRDVEAALEKGVPARPTLPQVVLGQRVAPTAAPLSSMRKVIAQRMAEVKPGVPHFYLTVEIEMDDALRIREEAKKLEEKVSVNDILVKAAAVALRRYPRLNVSLQGDQVLQFQNVDVGIAVALDEGLIAPVIRDADLKSLTQLAAEARDLAERARRRALRPEEYSGGALTISNLGMYGIDNFIAVINPPQASIVAVGAVAEKAVVRDGQLVIRKMMTATFSGDHRVIDGAVGAEYLRELKSLLEHPMRLLL